MTFCGRPRVPSAAAHSQACMRMGHEVCLQYSMSCCCQRDSKRMWPHTRALGQHWCTCIRRVPGVHGICIHQLATAALPGMSFGGEHSTLPCLEATSVALAGASRGGCWDDLHAPRCVALTRGDQSQGHDRLVDTPPVKAGETPYSFCKVAP